MLTKLILYTLCFLQCSQTIVAQVTAAPVCESTGHRCINQNQCNLVGTGSFQWCGGCEYYVQCSASSSGQLYGSVLPEYTQWDDNRKSFQTTSTTCVECYHPCPDGPSAPAEQECGRTGLGCLNDTCPSNINGNFQYCRNCDQYVTCNMQAGYSLVTCPTGNVYDDFARVCMANSTTCRECYDTCRAPTTQPPEVTTTVEVDGTTAGGPGNGDSTGDGDTTDNGNGDDTTNAVSSIACASLALTVLSILSVLHLS